ncbi:sulfur carrier protein ThiS [Leptospira ilyithenensis]|uniref:Sulfur carrier protein ThiS n=1 Tax=Leptospira ilyithenensis TaxID=2484901 RepID=A0A4R9LJS4_9LEPT|nr:sulfur carrier protein ThiS [Leptospira ilyithenensis]TGN07093.1 sulfur carrier protein ThiS [Leptospira ilyithenensis]
MKVEFNGKILNTTATTLAELLSEQKIDPTCIASAMDGEFVPRSRYNNTLLREAAKLEILSPMQGG